MPSNVVLEIKTYFNNINTSIHLRMSHIRLEGEKEEGSEGERGEGREGVSEQ